MMRCNMKTYRGETTVSNEGTVTLEHLPFQVGDKVEVIVRTCEEEHEPSEPYPLRGQPIRYSNLFESVAEEEWDR
jgi:hypothetical protein